MERLKKLYFIAWSSYWYWRSMRSKDYRLQKGYDAMYLAYIGKYKAIKYRPKGVRKC